MNRWRGTIRKATPAKLSQTCNIFVTIITIKYDIFKNFIYYSYFNNIFKFIFKNKNKFFPLKKSRTGIFLKNYIMIFYFTIITFNI